VKRFNLLLNRHPSLVAFRQETTCSTKHLSGPAKKIFRTRLLQILVDDELYRKIAVHLLRQEAMKFRDHL
jgi:hypothetical protein